LKKVYRRGAGQAGKDWPRISARGSGRCCCGAESCGAKRGETYPLWDGNMSGNRNQSACGDALGQRTGPL